MGVATEGGGGHGQGVAGLGQGEGVHHHRHIQPAGQARGDQAGRGALVEEHGGGFDLLAILGQGGHQGIRAETGELGVADHIQAGHAVLAGDLGRVVGGGADHHPVQGRAIGGGELPGQGEGFFRATLEGVTPGT
nr:hypothetical protein [Denitratisoma oestradiolicum]